MNASSFLEKLIAFPTISADSNAALIDWAAAQLQGWGAHVTILDAPEGKKALWARLGPEGPGGLALAGHTDVVPVKDQKWTSDPFTMAERNGLLYGRGACDMKGFIACAMAAMQQAASKPLAAPLYLALTYDEEVSMAGAKRIAAWLIERHIRPDWFWIGEPTSLDVVTAHKGITTFDATFTGVAGHSSLPHKGLNAISMAAAFIGKLDALAKEKESHPIPGSLFDPPFTTFNYGPIAGGDVHNIIPAFCSLVFEHRLHPGDDEAALRAAYEDGIRNIRAEAQKRFPSAQADMAIHDHKEPFDSVEGNDLAAWLCARTGSGAAQAVSYCTEAGLFQKTGARAIVVCGPGSITKAHQPDEYVPLADLEKCEALLTAFIDEKLRALA